MHLPKLTNFGLPGFVKLGIESYFLKYNYMRDKYAKKRR